jgi:lipoprotein-anchoring transpeptidase ErfK/SrfK
VRVPTRSHWGGIEQLLVVGVNEDGTWLRVRLDRRPNQASVWIPRNNVILSKTHWRVVISRSRHRLVVYYAGRARRSWRIVVGKPSTPTPRGAFAIAGELRQTDPNGFDGSWVLPLTAHSSVLHSFDGGDGQVALHGRGGASLNDPLGSSRSHGCVRMNNPDVAWLATHVPVGTPVDIT